MHANEKLIVSSIHLFECITCLSTIFAGVIEMLLPVRVEICRFYCMHLVAPSVPRRLAQHAVPHLVFFTQPHHFGIHLWPLNVVKKVSFL